MERGIARIETVRRYAPADPDELFREVGGFACGDIVDCRYKFQHQDWHHLNFPKSEFADDLGHCFRTHIGQVVEMCRCKHDSIHRTWQKSERPTNEYMVGWLQGMGHMTARTREAIKNFRRGRGKGENSS